MPNRIIRDQVKTSPTLAAASDFSERLFFRLVTAMDDFGRYHGSPRSIMAACFPEGAAGLTIHKVKVALEELERLDLLRFYDHDGRRYVFSPTWRKHQRVRASESKFPEPVDFKGRGHLTADDRDSRTSAAVNGNGVGNGNGTDKNKTSSRTNRAARFPDFWAVVKHRTSKAESEAIWKRMNLDPQADTIIAAYQNQLKWPQYQGDRIQYLKRPPSWLRKRAWEDEPERRETERERVHRVMGWNTAKGIQ